MQSAGVQAAGGFCGAGGGGVLTLGPGLGVGVRQRPRSHSRASLCPLVALGSVDAYWPLSGLFLGKL